MRKFQMDKYDDLFGEVELNKAVSKKRIKDLDAGQTSLFSVSQEDPNKEEIKKRLVEKADAEENKPKKQSTPEKRGAQSDMFEKDFKELKRAEAEKNFKAQQKLEDRPLPKHHRMPGSGGAGGMKPDTDITASKKLPKMAKGGSVSSASKRADGCATKGKTKGRIV
jgi:hypothetical protein